jgi:hypothetical protein
MATASLQRRDGRSCGEMGRGEEEWPMEGGGAALRPGGVGRGSG